MLHVALVFEIISILCCVDCVYGKKFIINLGSAFLILILLTFLEYVNYFDMGGISSLVTYVFIYVYCRKKYFSSVIKTIQNILFATILLACIEFMSVAFLNMWVSEKAVYRNLLQNTIVFLICILLLPRCHIHHMSRNLYKKNNQSMIIVGSVFFIVGGMILLSKFIGKIEVAFFILGIPFVLFSIWILAKYNYSSEQLDFLQKKTKEESKLLDKYEQLVMLVRIRQHDLKNHLTAIFASHYMYKTYEQLVKAQNDYSKQIVKDNQYNDLIKLEDKLVAGFLFEKFQKLGQIGINVQYTINSSMKQYKVSSYYVIELLGILLDNAAEAVNSDEYVKTIIVDFFEGSSEYFISIRNQVGPMTYEDIEQWFQAGKSNKGLYRGLGLYHARELCAELGCNIGVKLIKESNENWLEFTLGLEKAVC